MCDSFVALPVATTTGTTLAAKNADCEINEAQAVLHLPRRRYPEGATVRATHLVIPQARETHEVILDKSFWTWGGEIGLNEHGLAVGNEAIFSTATETQDGLITGDLLRLMLERARTCDEAVEVFTKALEAFGQGGNCELRGNGHFDSSYLVSDLTSAVIIETAGRHWAVRPVDGVGSIANAMTIGADWRRCSAGIPGNGAGNGSRVDFQARFEDLSRVADGGAHRRQSLTRSWLEAHRGRIDLRCMADLLRQHGEGYDPAEGEVCTNICMHVGPYPSRYWQACGAMIMDAGPNGSMAWVTATSGTCVSIFKPVYFGATMPDTGPMPRESFTDGTLWWRHELLHRRAMADFHSLGREIRAEFERLEDGFFAEGRNLLAGSAREKSEFMEECWRRAAEATDRWISRLERRNSSYRHQGYAAMWDRFDRAAAMPFIN